MKILEKTLTMDAVVQAMVKGGFNPKDAKAMVDKHFNDMMRIHRGQNLTPSTAVDIITSFEISESGGRDPMRDSVITIEKDVEIQQEDSIVILEKGDTIKIISESSRDVQIAQTIQQQLGSKALYMLGAKDLMAIENGLQFSIRGSQAYNKIQIILNGKDLYDVRFLKIRGANISKDDWFHDIYFDQLHELIEQQTGLYTSL